MDASCEGTAPPNAMASGLRAELSFSQTLWRSSTTDSIAQPLEPQTTDQKGGDSNPSWACQASPPELS
jgi:hypothetical protein